MHKDQEALRRNSLGPGHSESPVTRSHTRHRSQTHDQEPLYAIEIMTNHEGWHQGKKYASSVGTTQDVHLMVAKLLQILFWDAVRGFGAGGEGAG
eukprot:568248-Rhodomonas_salina.1